MSVNKVILLGNVGKDPEVRHFDNGGMVANFTIATSEKYTSKSGERVENTEWHNVSVFGKLAEIVEKYVSKGSQLYIEGKIKTRSYESGGEKKYITEVVLQDFGSVLQMIGKREQQETKTETYSASDHQDALNDNLPF